MRKLAPFVLITLTCVKVSHAAAQAVSEPRHAGTHSMKDLVKLRRMAASSTAFQAAREEGDLQKARRILEQQIMPDGGGYMRLAAALYLELGDFQSASRHHAAFMEKYKRDKNDALTNAQHQCFEILLQSLSSGEAADWSQLPSISDEIRPVAILEREFGSAVAEFYFQTASFLLKELVKLGASEDSLGYMRDGLAKQMKRQAEARDRARDRKSQP